MIIEVDDDIIKRLRLPYKEKGYCSGFMKKIVAFLLILSVMVIICGCSFSDKPLRISYDLKNEPKNLDPQTAQDIASLTIINNIFEGLVYLDNQGNIQKGMSVDYSISSDGLTYSFHLRENILWNDNNKKTEDAFITANDFVFGFQRLLNIDTNSVYANQYYCIKNAKKVNEGILPPQTLGVSAKSDYELVFELEYPNSNFLKLLTKTCAMPCNKTYFENTRGRYGLDADTVMANGPFIINSWVHNTSVRLSKNAEYYDTQSIILEGATLWIDTTDGDKEKKGMDNTVDRLMNEKTLAGFIDGFDLIKLDMDKFEAQPMQNETWGIIFNQRNDKLNNLSLRLAIATAFDRESYHNILPNSLQTANAIVPNGVLSVTKGTYRDHAGKVLVQEYDPLEAYELYKTAIAELKKVGTLTLLMPKSTTVSFSELFSYPSQILQRELGIFINVEEVEEVEYNKRLKNGDFDCALVDFESIGNEPRSILNCFETNSAENYMKYSNEVIDDLLKQAAEQTDVIQAEDIYIQVEKLLLEDVAFIPTYYKTDYFIVRNSIMNLKYNAQTGLLSLKEVIRRK